MERLAGGVAHEFNNKLAVVLGYTDVVSRELDAGNPTLAHLAQIRRAADDMAALANDILAFAGQQMLDPRPVAVRRIVDDLERTLGPALGARIDVVVEDGSDGALILADREQLERALMALALNARDAMPDGGQLSVLASVARERAPRDGETVSISMSDTGCGMSEELRKRIFEPFFATKEIGRDPVSGSPSHWGSSNNPTARSRSPLAPRRAAHSSSSSRHWRRSHTKADRPATRDRPAA